MPHGASHARRMTFAQFLVENWGVLSRRIVMQCDSRSAAGTRETPAYFVINDSCR
jgi:hypothetical protein